jgi:hypothetical protein
MWRALIILLLSSTAANAACGRDQFRLRSTGGCVAKNSELGHRYYRSGRSHVVRHRSHRLPVPKTTKRKPIPELIKPSIMVPEPDPPEDGVWPPLDPSDGATFEERFKLDNKGDRL